VRVVGVELSVARFHSGVTALERLHANPHLYDIEFVTDAFSSSTPPDDRQKLDFTAVGARWRQRRRKEEAETRAKEFRDDLLPKRSAFSTSTLNGTTEVRLLEFRRQSLFDYADAVNDVVLCETNFRPAKHDPLLRLLSQMTQNARLLTYLELCTFSTRMDSGKNVDLLSFGIEHVHSKKAVPTS